MINLDLETMPLIGEIVTTLIYKKIMRVENQERLFSGKKTV